MTQAIVNNAAGISFNRDLTVASTTSQSRQTKWFRKGPIQSTADVRLNVMRRETWQPILASLSANLLGPYDLTFPAEVVGEASSHTITVNGPDQSDTDRIEVASTASSVVATAGSLISFAGVKGSFVLLSDIETAETGVGIAHVDHPLTTAPADNAECLIGSDISFSMLLVDQPQVSYGPTGLVATDGAYRFVEDL